MGRHSSIPVTACRQEGFSLFELLIVLVMLGILAGITAPAMGRFLDQLAFRKETGEVLAQLRAARLLAITKGTAVTLTAADGPTLRRALDGNEPQLIATPKTLRVHFTPAVITFFPEGFAAPAAIVLGRGSRAARFTIDPLSGLPVRERS